MVDEAGTILATIVGDIATVSDLIDNIAQGGEEQTQGVGQLNFSVAQMKRVTQQNASGAEQSASASEEMVAQAAAVHSIVNEPATVVGGDRAGKTGLATVGP